MQFHFNGFRPGDPTFKPERDDVTALANTDKLPEKVDVLIVGCGPAGLALAAQLSRFPEINTRIVEQKPGPLTHGQADGIACRTMEMFQAFGFAEKIAREACWISEVTFWKPSAEEPSRIIRSDRIQDVADDLSEFPHVVLNQARVHDHYLDVMRTGEKRLEPNYARKFVDVAREDDESDYPLTVTLERIDEAHQGEVETVRAKYVIGCDGARSAVRQAMGRTLEGQAAHQAWGVMDILAETDFPDLRMKSVIQSAEEGSILLIPREGGYLFRVYVELDKLKEDERVRNKNISVDYLTAAAQRIFHPYSLDVKDVAWWSVYEIGHRICEKFDDVSPGEEGQSDKLPRIFIAGDACHTHSPKMGQGMNVSMQDTFNLGWKLAHVLIGRSGPELLNSYSDERKAIAQDLIDFDSAWARMLSTPLKSAEHPDGVEPEAIKQQFVELGRYTAGVATVYKPSILTGSSGHQALATGLGVGMRFHSAPVIRLGDAKPMQIGHTVEADGRWRLFAFNDQTSMAERGSRLEALCAFLETDPSSPVVKYTPKGADIDAVIDVRAIFQQHFRELDLEAMPSLLLPKRGVFKLTDREKMFSADIKSGQDIFDMRGIDRQKGCMVIVRPDQYIGHVLPLDAHEEIAAYFDCILRQPD